MATKKKELEYDEMITQFEDERSKAELEIQLMSQTLEVDQSNF